MGGIFDEETGLLKVSSAKQPPKKPPIDAERDSAMRSGLKDGSWMQRLASTITASPMEGRAGAFGPSPSISVVNPTPDDTPTPVDLTAHLNRTLAGMVKKSADISQLGLGVNPNPGAEEFRKAHVAIKPNRLAKSASRSVELERLEQLWREDRITKAQFVAAMNRLNRALA